MLKLEHLKMKNVSIKALFVLFGVHLCAATPAYGAPHVYVSSWKLNYSTSECVDDAYTIARKHGFSDDRELLTGSTGKVKSLYATHRSGELSIVIQCDRDSGTAVFAVSGYDNDEAYDMMRDIGDSYQEL